MTHEKHTTNLSEDDWKRVQEAEDRYRDVIEELFVDNREKALALTKLDEAALWLTLCAGISSGMRSLLAKMRSAK